MTLTTLADIRQLVEHLAAECRERHTWRHVANELHQAARGLLAGLISGLLFAAGVQLYFPWRH